MRSRLFICSTKYTILNSIRLSREYCNSNSDIIVFARDKSTTEFALSLSKTSYFDKILIGSDLNRRGYLSIAFMLFFPKYMFSRMGGLRASYDEVFGQSWTHVILARNLAAKKRFDFVEEGLSSYTDRVYDLKNKSFLIRIILFYLERCRKFNLEFTIHLNLPGLYQGNSGRTKKIPLLTDEVVFSLKRLFLNSHLDRIRKISFIYLGVPFYGLNDLQDNGSKNILDIDTLCQNLNTHIFSKINSEELLYRPHPLEKPFFKNNDILEDNGELNWEIFISEMSEDICLINYFSTAAFTPKLLYGKEPRIIFLYKLVGLNLLNGDLLINQFKSLYKDPSKVVVPVNLSELELYLDVK